MVKTNLIALTITFNFRHVFMKPIVDFEIRLDPTSAPLLFCKANKERTVVHDEPAQMGQPITSVLAP